jgi:rubrerythrin
MAKRYRCKISWDEYYKIFKDSIESDQTLECPDCGRTLHGDEPYIQIPCHICYDIRESKKDVKNES